MWTALIPVAFSIVKGINDAFGRGKGAEKKAASIDMLRRAAEGALAAGNAVQPMDDSALGLVTEVVHHLLKSRGEIDAPATPAQSAPAKDVGDNPPLTMPIPDKAVLTIQF